MSARRLLLFLSLALAVAAAAQAQPAPLAPPTTSGPAPTSTMAPSPILTQPGPFTTAPAEPRPVAPPPAAPGPIDQQKKQSYRSGLIQQQRQLELQGVSPADERSREIQQQLNAPGR